MTEMLEYFKEGYSFTNLLYAIVVAASLILCLEKSIQWLYKYFLILYKRRKGQEEESETLDKTTEELKKLSDNIDRLAMLLNRQYSHLDRKIDEQKERLNTLEKEGQMRDCAILRDRILGGMRYFGQQKDASGTVHITVSEHENMTHLFEAYFNCKGNGTIKTMYENEFKSWVIDR